MTPKQERFVQEWLVDPNATQAAIRAGYSEKTAYKIGAENLRKPQIKQAIDRAKAERAERMKINADEVLRRFDEIYQRCMTAVPILDAEGNPTGEWKFDAGNANRANENIAEHIGFYPDKKLKLGGDPDAPPVKVEHSGTVFTDRIDALTDAFEGAARRSLEGTVPGDDSGEPVDS